MIESFSRERFEAALSRAAQPLGLSWESAFEQGEWVYSLRVPQTNKRLLVRSSVGQEGWSAGTGQDSIRLWAEYFYRKAGKWLALGKLDRWTTRLPGWEQRLAEKLAELHQLVLEDSGFSAGRPAPDRPVPEPARIPVQPVRPREPAVQGRTLEAPILSGGDWQANRAQREAIEAPIQAAVRVLAPPGAGKTAVIARRYGWLLEHGARPEQILAVTFSKAMAEELLARIGQVNPSVRGTAAEQQVCTIHAACYRILRAEGDRRQLARTWQEKKLLNSIAGELWLQPPAWKELAAWIQAAKVQGLEVGRDLEFYVQALGEVQGTLLALARQRFDQGLRGQGLITFPDMLLGVDRSLQQEASFRRRWQDRFRWVIVDEGQDTTGQAMRILTTLAGPQDQFFIVGDPDQLLYRFAGATPEANLLQGFEERFPAGLTVQLEVNYRSSQALVAAQGALIGHNYSDQGGPYPACYQKKVQARPGAPEGRPISFRWFASPEEEAREVTASLVEALAQGRRPGDFFLAARTRAQLGYLEGPLVRAGIPFVNATGSSFWSSSHVQALVSYLALALDEGSSLAFQRVYNMASRWFVHPWGERVGLYCPHRYLGQAFLEACQESGQPRYRKAWEAVSQRRAFEPGVRDLTEFVGELQGLMAQGSSPTALVRQVIDGCLAQYLRHEEGLLAGDEAEDGQLEDLETVADLAASFSTVREFLDFVELALRAAAAAQEQSWEEFVVLSTIHRLKGLERPVVFGLGLAENGAQGLLPHTFSMSPAPEFGVLTSPAPPSRMEDERCLAFVLVSRAREEVHLSGCARYRKSPFGPSRFIGELGLSVEPIEVPGAGASGPKALLKESSEEVSHESALSGNR